MNAQRWEDDAACQQIGAIVFHPTGRGAELAEAIAAAKAICNGACPVVKQCLQAALEREGTADRYSRDGIWGGLTGQERAALNPNDMRKAV
ncbi:MULTISPECIES: WhiB family transcriptional regulator [unclassified Streptomyces]|uniref:WhiB family transcriptional regulator n=1 Tax=unclassified Streptomyces TaxID=2593676 RepID=UPI00331F69D5